MDVKQIKANRTDIDHCFPPSLPSRGCAGVQHATRFPIELFAGISSRQVPVCDDTLLPAYLCGPHLLGPGLLLRCSLRDNELWTLVLLCPNSLRSQPVIRLVSCGLTLLEPDVVRNFPYPLFSVHSFSFMLSTGQPLPTVALFAMVQSGRTNTRQKQTAPIAVTTCAFVSLRNKAMIHCPRNHTSLLD